MRCKHACLTYQLLTVNSVIFFMSQHMYHLTVVIALIVWQFYGDQKLFFKSPNVHWDSYIKLLKLFQPFGPNENNTGFTTASKWMAMFSNKL